MSDGDANLDGRDELTEAYRRTLRHCIDELSHRMAEDLIHEYVSWGHDVHEYQGSEQHKWDVEYAKRLMIDLQADEIAECALGGLPLFGTVERYHKVEAVKKEIEKTEEEFYSSVMANQLSKHLEQPAKFEATQTDSRARVEEIYNEVLKRLWAHDAEEYLLELRTLATIYRYIGDAEDISLPAKEFILTAVAALLATENKAFGRAAHELVRDATEEVNRRYRRR
ncbi:MAG: hypothetical protein LYZ69_08545 [Nitrososphaerales archaeon]|nr:hypothetical protein [Nitrososphaerales archaeon]